MVLKLEAIIILPVKPSNILAMDLSAMKHKEETGQQQCEGILCDGNKPQLDKQQSIWQQVSYVAAKVTKTSFSTYTKLAQAKRFRLQATENPTDAKLYKAKTNNSKVIELATCSHAFL